MARFWTSDTHYFHDNIIRYCERPYAGVEAMNEDLIARWNKVVAPCDTVYHLGDFAMRAKKRVMEEILSRLNGEKVLVSGNHDASDTRKLKGWARVTTHETTRLGHHEVFMIHDPMLLDRVHTGPAIVLHGHHHGQKGKHDWPPTRPDRTLVDVGVDVSRWNYTPVDIFQIIARLQELNVEFSRPL